MRNLRVCREREREREKILSLKSENEIFAVLMSGGRERKRL